MSQYTRFECGKHGPFLATLTTHPPPLASALCPACNAEAHRPSLEVRDFFSNFWRNAQDELTTFFEGTEMRDWIWLGWGVFFGWLVF